MFDYIDKKLENGFKKVLHKKRKKIIDDVLAECKKRHPMSDAAESSLRVKMELEADRVIAMADRSIIRASIQRAKLTFLIAVLAGLAVVITLGILSGFTLLPFITPLVSGCAAWLVAIALIPTSYIQRLKGGMDSVIVLYEDSLREPENTSYATTTAKLLQIIPQYLNQETNPSLDEISKVILSDRTNIKDVFLWKKPPAEDKLETGLAPDNSSDDVFVTFVMNMKGGK